MNKRAIWLSGLTLLVTPLLAPAQNSYMAPGTGGRYFSVQVGNAQLNDHSFDVAGAHVTAASDDAVFFSFGGGYDYGRIWPLGGVRVELMLEHRNNDIDKLFLPQEAPLPSPAGQTEVWSVMYNVLNDFRPGTGFDPYIGVGIGYARLDFQNYRSTGVTLLDDRISSFAYQGMIGFRSALTADFNLDFGWRYFRAPSPTVAAVDGTHTDTTYASQAVTVGFEYRF